jgi:hypothetical protein
VHRISHHNARNRESTRQPSQGAQVVPAVVTPLECQHRLRSKSQLVGHGDPDAPVADVEAEIAGLWGRFQLATPGFQLKAWLRMLTFTAIRFLLRFRVCSREKFLRKSLLVPTRIFRPAPRIKSPHSSLLEGAYVHDLIRH